MMTMRQRSLWVAALASVALIGSGCDRRPAETAGQTIDRAADIAKQQIDRTTNEAAQKTKEVAAKASSTVDDAAITAKVKAALFAEPGLKTLQIEVETNNGVVTLAGAVDSVVLRQRAVEIVGAMMGVREVDNKLIVKS